MAPLSPHQSNYTMHDCIEFETLPFGTRIRLLLKMICNSLIKGVSRLDGGRG